VRLVERQAKSIAVHSFKGGTGKSTITANTSVALALDGKRVCVMDMDLEGPGLHVIFNIDPSEVKYTLNDVLRGSASPEMAAISMNDRLGLSKGEIYFCPASSRVDEMLKTLRTGFEVDSFSKAIARLKEHFKLDFLLIDTHPGIENDTLLSMGVCEHLLIVSRLDQQDIFGTGVIIELARVLEKPAHLALNMVPKGIKDSQITLLAKKIAANLNTELLTWLPFSDDILGSLSKSVFLLSMPKNPMSERFTKVARAFEAFDQKR
jgi:septum site-determining protein MinD